MTEGVLATKGVHVHKRDDRGFTLVEVLVSISIFSFIALGAFRLLSSTAAVTDVGQSSSDQTFVYRKAINVITGDLRNAVPRKMLSSNPVVPAKPAFLSDPITMLEFSRGAYGPSAGPNRSAAVRVRYELRETQEQDLTNSVDQGRFDLVRHISPMDGDYQGVEREQLLLRNVESASLRFMDSDGQWHRDWPQPQKVASSSLDSMEQPDGVEKDRVPRAVELGIETSVVSGPVLIALRD